MNLENTVDESLSIDPDAKIKLSERLARFLKRRAR